MGLITTSSPFLANIEYEKLDNSEQELVQALIDLASEHLEQQCRRRFEQQTFTELHDGDGSRSLLLNNPPIVTINEVSVITTSETLEYSSLYFLPENNPGIITWNPRITTDSLGYFPRGKQNISVEYIGGYDTIPKTVEFLVAEMVIEAFAKDAGVNNVVKQKLGQYFIDYGPQIFDRVLLHKKQILHSLRVKSL